MASSRRPRMSLPPELGDIDAAWSEDEQPTIARPSRMPTAPVRIEIPSDIPTAPGLDLAPMSVPEIEMPALEAPPPQYEPDLAEEGEDVQERVTTVPDIPPDEYARRIMAANPQTGGPDVITQAPPAEQETPTEAAGPHGHGPGVLARSDIPTAPPPLSFKEDPIHVAVPSSSVLGISLDPGSEPTDRPPPAPRLSQPRTDIPAFSGRFSSAPPTGSPLARDQAMKDKFAMGDFSGALKLAEAYLQESPSDVEAVSLAAKCREVLEDMYASRISGMQQVPAIVMTSDQIRWLSLDHRAGFLLSMIDGMSSLDDLLDVSGMQRLDALRIVCTLLDQKVIALN